MASAISVGELTKIIQDQELKTLVRFETFPNGQVYIRVGDDAPIQLQFLSDYGAAASFTSYEIRQPQSDYKYPDSVD